MRKDVSSFMRRVWLLKIISLYLTIFKKYKINV